jgi:DNA primase small subunit
MTDYDPIRTCCSGAGICKRCWGFIAAAVGVLHDAIRHHFGYQKLLWVYSGRRGIHLWISDPEAMDLTDDQRKALVEFLILHLGGEKGNKKLNIRNGPRKLLLPSFQYAHKSYPSFFFWLTFTLYIISDMQLTNLNQSFQSSYSLINSAFAVPKGLKPCYR